MDNPLLVAFALCTIIMCAAQCAQAESKKFSVFEWGSGLLLCVAMTVILAIRDPRVGNDTLSVYLPVFWQMGSLTDALDVAREVYSYDSPLYWYFVWACHAVNKSEWFYFGAQAAVVYFLIYMIARSAKIPSHYLAFSFTATLLWLMAVSNTLRQGIAVFLFLLSIMYAARGSISRSIVVAAISALTHSSGVVSFLCVGVIAALPSIGVNSKNGWKVVVLGVVLFAPVAVYLVFGDAFAAKQDFYVNEGFSFSATHPLARPWVLLTIASDVFVGIKLFQSGLLVAPIATLKRFTSVPEKLLIVYFSLSLAWLSIMSNVGLFERFGDFVVALQVLLIVQYIWPRLKNSFLVFFIFCGLLISLAANNFTGASAALSVGF
jgi:hypothetical protein